MCRKLLFLIAVLGLVSTAWADDPNPPEWRGEPGSAVFQWTYDADAPQNVEPYPRVDAPEIEQIIPHPHKENPGNLVERAYEEGWVWDTHWEEGAWVEAGGLWGLTAADYDVSAMQLWAEGTPGIEGYWEEAVWMEREVPTGPTWNRSYMGREGVLTDFKAGSWDIYNFSSDPPQPEKWIQIQLTWQAISEPVTFFEYEIEGFLPAPFWFVEGFWQDAGWNYGEEEYDGWLEGWPGEEPPAEVWWEEGAWACWGVYEVAWWSDVAGWVEEGWWDDFVFVGGELIPFEIIDLEGDWELWKFLIEFGPNPNLEFLGLIPNGWDLMTPIAVDQIVIDTICIPEPATIALLGLGGLFLIRRRKR